MKDLALRQTDQTRIQQSFQRGLATYHSAATCQASIAARLVEELAGHNLSTPLAKVFEFGCGTGHLTNALCATFEIDQLTLNDLVPDCRGFVNEFSQDFRPGPVESVALPDELSLICSASTIQWVDDVRGLLRHLANHLRSGGLLALSGFGTRQFHELRALGSTADAPSYLDASDWPHLLPDGLELLTASQAPHTMWFDTALDVLKHLRATGVNGAASKKWTTRDLRAFEKQYAEKFGTPDGLPLTYDPVWVICRKANAVS